MSNIHPVIDRLLTDLDRLFGGRSRRHFREFVRSAWADGSYARRADESLLAAVEDVAAAWDAEAFVAVDCYRPDQLPARNCTVYDGSYAIRVVQDSPDDAPLDQPISEYNIEPHVHPVDSIIIVASKADTRVGDYLVHREEGHDEFVAAVPLDFGNIIAFPRSISHTFRPSDTGLLTINMTESEIVPHTPGFGSDALVNMDRLPRIRVQARS